MWKGPERTGFPFPSLGFALLDWWFRYLPSPRDSASPLVFTDEQAMVLLRWYEVDPRTGQFLHRRGCSRRSKGSGKSPVEAAKDIAELAGPVVFDGWDAVGNAVGRPWGTGELPDPWVQVAAVSEDQTDNTWSVLHALLSDNDGRAADELGVDPGLTRCFLRARRGRAEPVTAAAGSREGQPVTYASLDETHLWTPRNGGVKLANTLRRNVAKMAGRSYETTNSYMPGEGSVAEATDKAVAHGRGIFYDAVEAPHEVDGVEVNESASDAILAKALTVPYAGCWWTPIERLVAEVRDPDMSWSDASRFFFNWNTKGEGKAVDPKRWDALTVERVIVAGERIGLGFDGSISGDSTALLGCTADGHSFEIAVWDRPVDEQGRPVKDWRVPRLEVKAKVRETFETFRVGRMFCDPPKWYSEIEEWAEEFGDDVVLLLETNSTRRFAPAVDRWLTALKEGSHTNDGSLVVRRHVLAAHLQKVKATAAEDDGRTLYVIVKGADGRKIDACIGDVLAFEAASTMPAGERVAAYTSLDDV